MPAISAISQLAHTLQRLSLVLRSLAKFLRHRRKQDGVVPQIFVETQGLLQRENRDPPCADNTNKLKVHNEEQPISQLPYELLLQIFTSGALPPHASRYPAFIQKHCSTKRHLTQVCHRWRKIALESPDIWCSAIDLASGSLWIGEVLRRSRDRPISVFIPSGTKEEHIALALRAPKVRGLYANVQDPYLARKLLSHIGGLQGLEELDLVTCQLPPSRFRDAEGGGYKDPASESPPLELRRLYLNGPSIRLPQRQMITLTCLYITRSWGSKMPFQWLAAIQRFPSLQELSLINCIKADGTKKPFNEKGPDPIFSPPISVALPHLRELELRGDHSACGDVFRGLTFPSSCVLRMETHDATIGPTLDGIIGFLQPNLSHPPLSRSAPNRSLHLKFSLSQFYLQVFEEEVVKLSIHMKYREWHNQQVDPAVLIVGGLLSATCARFQLWGGIKTLKVSLSVQLPKSPQPDLRLSVLFLPLLKVEEVQNLCLQGTTTAYELSKHLGGPNTTSASTAGNGFECVLFPNLRQITLTGVDIEGPEAKVISAQLVSYISRHPKLKVARFQNSQWLRPLVDALSSIDVKIITTD